LLDCKVPTCKEIAVKAPIQLDYLDQTCREHFAGVQGILAQMHIPYQVNPGIVRGLDYYTNTAFEIVGGQLGAQNSLAGGGRYNGLLEQVGGRSIPAVGFAGGFERLLLMLEADQAPMPAVPVPDVYLAAIGETAQQRAFALINALRLAGLYAEFEPDRVSLKSQLKSADSQKARFALIIGEDELATQSCILKDLQSGEQRSLPLEPLADIIAILKA